PQSNGKQERFHGSLKSECIRVMAPMNKAEAERIIDDYVNYYNNQRLHSATSYITPSGMLKGRQKQILGQRDQKLKEAKIQRRKDNLNKKDKESSYNLGIKSA
ncbi:MAG: integrase core domain-containing protein, partial [Lentisphaeraceae bacterium]|nr:integrase core domain-containing protein [Lentisphaeraceae bacterium]